MKTRYTVEPDPADYDLVRVIQTTTMTRVEFEAIHSPLILSPKVLSTQREKLLQHDIQR